MFKAFFHLLVRTIERDGRMQSVSPCVVVSSFIYVVVASFLLKHDQTLLMSLLLFLGRTYVVHVYVLGLLCGPLLSLSHSICPFLFFSFTVLNNSLSYVLGASMHVTCVCS